MVVGARPKEDQESLFRGVGNKAYQVNKGDFAGYNLSMSD